MAIAVGVIETDAFRRVAEAVGLFFGVKVDDGDVLVLRPADIFGEVRIYPAGLAIAPFVLALLFCGCDLAAPGGAVRRPISSGARKK